MSWIFACGLRFNRKSQPCIFFRWFALHFRVKTYAKKQPATGRFAGFIVRENNRFLCLARSTTDCKKRRRVFCIRFYSKMKRKPAEKNTGLWLSIKSETTCKNSAHLDEKKNRPKFDIEWLCSKRNAEKFHFVLFGCEMQMYNVFWTSCEMNLCIKISWNKIWF